MELPTYPIVFLHIPKTAGQAIHNSLVQLVGGTKHVSPVRVHTQSADGSQMPPGYRLYSGHLDWVGLDDLFAKRFAFTVLRDPAERIASFYFYLRKEAEALSPEQLQLPENIGKRRILETSADDYFFGGDSDWQRFVLDHYDNFYCSYFATRKMRGRAEVATLSPAEAFVRARAGLDLLDGVYLTTKLEDLERDIQQRFGSHINVVGRYYNKGPHQEEQARWPKLIERMESDASCRRLEQFLDKDTRLMATLEAEALAG